MEMNMQQDNTPAFLAQMATYKKTTDVQKTWREYGWRPPSDDPHIQQKWHFYRTLTTDKR